MEEEKEVKESFDAIENFRKEHPEEARSLQTIVSLAHHVKEIKSVSPKVAERPADRNLITTEL